MNSPKANPVVKDPWRASAFWRERVLRIAATVTSRRAVTLAFFFALLVAAGTPMQAQYSVLYSFTGPDGANPHAGVVRDLIGNLYGTTYNGGANGYGTVFALTPSGTEKVLYSFTNGTDGAWPSTGLIRLDTFLFGTIQSSPNDPFGSFYKVFPTTGKFKLMYTFAGGTDGAWPVAAVVRDAGANNVYGTTSAGGVYGYGTIFHLPYPLTSENVLYNFTGGTDGAYPEALFWTASGYLYGTTNRGGTTGCGGAGCGTVFKLDYNLLNETVLHTFTGAPDGAWPVAAMVQPWRGNFYGTTLNGGVAGGSCSDPNGCGTVFEVAADGTYNVIYRFTGGTDGVWPVGLVVGSNGNLFGTTYSGGLYGYGTIFELKHSRKGWTEKVLYSFTGGADGANPDAGLLYKKHHFYGTTYYGGNPNCSGGCGVVFELTP
ncbi:MAG: choice-of-anchor tandem repeat GloVer-containing protein [Terriglobales bacterium]